MKTPVDLFDEWVADQGADLGRRYHPIPAEIADPFEKQRRTFNRRKGDLNAMFLPKRNIEIYLDFTDDPICDAVAGINADESTGFIAICMGAVILPHEMFFNMFSHPLILQEVGKSAMEKRNGRHTEGLLTNYLDLMDLRKKANRNIWPQSPVDETRNVIAQMCAEIVGSFIMLHELIHLVHGHIDFLRSRCRARQALRAMRSVKPPSDLDYQAAELWADSKAVAVNLGGFLTINQGIQYGQSFSRDPMTELSSGVLRCIRFSESGN